MYKHILLASDGSENAARAAKEAVKIASMSGEGTSIDVVHVIDIDKSKYDVLHNQSKEQAEIERLKKNSHVIQYLNEAKVDYKTTVLRGNPGSEIIKYANERKVDLIVVGSRGRNKFQEMMLGSVSDRLIKNIACPALVVK